MKRLSILAVCLFALYGCGGTGGGGSASDKGQDGTAAGDFHEKKKENKPRLLGTCEGCEAVFEYGDVALRSVDTLVGFAEGDKPLRMEGTIYQPDGQTPAEGVILYVYHTDTAGLYTPAPDATGWGERHGERRAWLKTGADGRYTFYTQMPGSYPDGSEPSHIHPIILEPDGNYYWLGSYFFEGDPNLRPGDLNPERPRGGSQGVIRLRRAGKLWVGRRDFVLGKNVEGYPE